VFRVRPYDPGDTNNRAFVFGLVPRLAIGMPSWRDLTLWLTMVENWVTESINQHNQKTEEDITLTKLL